MTLKNKGIIAYGTEEDRQKLAVLSHLAGKSASAYLISLIQRTYHEVVGETDPSIILPNHD